MKVPRLFASAALVAAFSVPVSAQQGDRIGPSGGEVAAAAVGVGAVVAVVVVLAVSHGHHTISGCVISGPHGLELQTRDSRTWTLEGDSADLKAGHRVKIHGSRIKKPEGNPAAFRMQRLDKDNGLCNEAQPQELNRTP